MKARNWVGLGVVLAVVCSMFATPVAIVAFDLGAIVAWGMALAQVSALGLGTGLLLD